MRLAHNAHLAYCTNVHPGNDWDQTFHSLQRDVLKVRRAVCPNENYAIGLRLSAAAAQALAQPQTLADFRRWLDQQGCYVFTINGFPYGNFHGERVKEQVYRPDWTTQERLDYTNLLFDLLAELLPPGVAGSVSTLPGSFKRFITTDAQRQAIHHNLHRCYQHIEALCESRELDLHLGLEPEPLGLIETTPETVAFFEAFTQGRPEADRIRQRIGVNYDTCHLAVEYESAAEALGLLGANGIRVSKIHLSSALKVEAPGPDTLDLLERFCEPTYLHQVLARAPGQPLQRYEDLPQALAARREGSDASQEWRVHFHIPLHSAPTTPLLSTSDHLLETLDAVAQNPRLCQHFEMETYTWAVLPKSLQSPDVAEQITKEYRWLLPELKARGLLA